MSDTQLSWWLNGLFPSGETAAQDRAEVWELCEELFQNHRQEGEWEPTGPALSFQLLITAGLLVPVLVFHHFQEHKQF